MRTKQPHEMTIAEMVKEIRWHRVRAAKIDQLVEANKVVPKRCEINIAQACDCDKICEYPKQYGKNTK